MRTAVRTFLAGVVVLAAGLLSSQPASRDQPGPLPDGGTLLPTGWRITPAGKQTPLDQFPMSAALTPDGKHLLVLRAGRTPGISVLEVASGRVVSAVAVPGAWLGLTVSPRGDRVYAGGGAQAAILEFTFANGTLIPARSFEVAPAAKRGDQDFIGDVASSPDGRLLYAADLFRDSIAVINPQSGMLISRVKTGRRPYRILFHPDGKSFFVSHWADGSVGHYDAASGSALTSVRIGAHPTDLLWRNGGPAEPEPGQPTFAARLFVAAANTNNVYAVAVTQAKDLKVIESIHVAMTPHQPLGMTPSALALSADGNRIFVACSDANAVAVVNVTGERSQVEGFIPTGWYPTALRTLSGGGLVVLNGKGSPGSASWIDPFTPQQLDAWTKTVQANSGYRDSSLMEKAPLPPIQHVVYIVRGSAAENAANFQKLGREFVLLDNFHTIGGTAAEIFQWSTAAIASDYVQKLGVSKPIDPETQEPAVLPPAGYLWNNAALAGLSIRNFGFGARDPGLARVTNANFRGTEAERVNVFLAELAGYAPPANMPRLTLIRLESDAALGVVVEGISKSRFWNNAAIFVTGNQGPALLISPYVKRRTVDSTLHNTVSMLRTIELLLGLRPMTHFDAGARPMTASFQAQPDPAPYSADKK